MKHVIAASLLTLLGLSLESQQPTCPPGYRGNQMRACAEVLPRNFTDLVPALQPDGSYLIPLPLPFSTPDPNSIVVFVNGVAVSRTPDAVFSAPEYSIDPANPLRLIPNVATWPTEQLRVNLTVLL